MSALGPAAPARGTARPGRVLLIDDEPAVGIAVQRVLRAHSVTVVSSGPAALELLASGEQFDVVLSDLMMPGMSGIQLYALLAEQHPRMASRIVFLTGGAFTPEASEFLDRVANERIEKPFSAALLRETVESFIK